jgi:hypothetical protein
MKRFPNYRHFHILFALMLMLLTYPGKAQQGAKPTASAYDFHDSHFHLTNYIQGLISESI